MDEIKRLQKNMLLIRRTVGWTATELGEKIGVTRQTINNIENGRNRLNKTQYIAIRSVLDAEIHSSPTDTEMLKILLDVLIDNPENYSEKVINELVDKANLMVPGILVGTASREKVSKEWMILAAAIAGTTLFPAPVMALGVISVSEWLRKLVVKNKSNKRTKESHVDNE